MRFLLSMAILAICGPILFAADPLEWKEFPSQEGRFRVLMPSPPRQTTAVVDGDLGKYNVHMNFARTDQAIYGVNFSDLPVGTKIEPLKEVYASARNGVVTNMRGKLASEKDITVEKYPAREIQVEVADGTRLFRARVFLVDQRLYQVVVFGKAEAAKAPLADKYLDSFKLGEK